MRFALILAAWAVATPAFAAAQTTGPAGADTLAAITARGRALQAYDQAAWHGTDAAHALAGNDTTGPRRRRSVKCRFALARDTERFTVSADGMTITQEHRMHNSIIAQALDEGVPAGAHVTAGFHTDVVEDVPQDTDVFHVLSRTPPLPDYVSANGQLYLIQTDGTIVYKGAAPGGAR